MVKEWRTLLHQKPFPYYAVRDPKAHRLSSEERKIPLFKKKRLLYVQLRPEAPDAERFANHLLRPFPKGIRFYVQLDHETSFAQNHDHSFDMQRVFVTIELQDVLYLQLRGTKAPTLTETGCKIPALNNKESRSVNHAYTSSLKRSNGNESRTPQTCFGRFTSSERQITCVRSSISDVTGQCCSRSVSVVTNSGWFSVQRLSRARRARRFLG